MTLNLDELIYGDVVASDDGYDKAMFIAVRDEDMPGFWAIALMSNIRHDEGRVIWMVSIDSWTGWSRVDDS